MAGKDTDRATYIRVLKELKAFRQLTYNQPSLGDRDFLYSKLNNRIVSSYYRIRKLIKTSNISSPEIKQLVRKMPKNIRLLQKGIFEILMICGILMCLIIVYAYTPSFKGRFPTFISFTGLLWFFLRRAIENLDSDMTYSISDLIKAIEKEIKELKK